MKMWSVSFIDAGNCHNYIAWIKETSVWSIIRIILTGEYRRTVRKTSVMAILSTTNPTRTCLGSKAGPRRWERDHRPSCQQLCRKVANKLTVKTVHSGGSEWKPDDGRIAFLLPLVPQKTFSPKNSLPNFLYCRSQTILCSHPFHSTSTAHRHFG
jgi:hypothetical protein